MKIGPGDKIWVVTDATPVSVLEDVCFETTLRGLELQFRGGLSMDSNPTIYTKKDEALLEARKRLKVAQFVEKIRNAEITEDE
jgi:hypothetical protein